MQITYCCFELSSRCNMCCEFCFSDWRKSKEELSTKDAKHILDVLKENGLKAINLTGGEILLRKDIVEICEYAKEIGLTLIISTNGIELLNKKEVLKYLDAINLPLDSHNLKIHNQMRPCKISNHHELILRLIDYISNEYPKVKIKINTMVSEFNKNEVVEIGKLIDGKIYCWKLGKFMPSGYGSAFKDKYFIADNDFKKIVEKVSDIYPNSGFFKEEFRDEYIFIDNQGNIKQMTANGITNHGWIDNLSRLEEINTKEKYFNEVYNKKGA